VNFIEIFNICANQLVIKVAVRIISSDKLSRSYDNLYLGIPDFGTESRCWYEKSHYISAEVVFTYLP